MMEQGIWFLKKLNFRVSGLRNFVQNYLTKKTRTKHENLTQSLEELRYILECLSFGVNEEVTCLGHTKA